MSKPEMMTFLRYLEEELTGLRISNSLRSELVDSAPAIDASSNDYLGIAVSSVSRETSLPVGAGASRLIHGTTQEHLALERELACWVGAPNALLFSSGYAANLGLISAVFGNGGTIVSDQANHASIIDGCRLSRAQIRVVPHLALGSIEEALRESEGAHPLGVVLESYFSMDGDGPDLTGVRAACDRYGAFLFVDEAHALGVYGPEGGGRCREAGVVPDALVGGLGKAVGGHGGFVAGSEALRCFLWNKARSFVFSTAISPLLSEHLLMQVREVRGADSARRRLFERCEALRERLRSGGLHLIPGSFGPIVSVVLGDNNHALQVAQRLAAVGVRVQAIRPPTVPVGSARVRVSLKSWLSAAEIDFIAEAVIAACRS